jgi:hypothetical protein
VFENIEVTELTSLGGTIVPPASAKVKKQKQQQHTQQDTEEVLENGQLHQNTEQTSEPTTDDGIGEPDEDLF